MCEAQSFNVWNSQVHSQFSESVCVCSQIYISLVASLTRMRAVTPRQVPLETLSSRLTPSLKNRLSMMPEFPNTHSLIHVLITAYLANRYACTLQRISRKKVIAKPMDETELAQVWCTFNEQMNLTLLQFLVCSLTFFTHIEQGKNMAYQECF